MRTLFADTNYIVAILVPRDPLHKAALQLSSEIASCHVVTTDFVWFEVFRLFSRGGPAFRYTASESLRRFRKNPGCEIIPASRDLMDKAIALYEARLDKDWDLVDCSSFVIMKELGLTEGLTADAHFIQAGFRALLRESD